MKMDKESEWYRDALGVPMRPTKSDERTEINNFPPVFFFSGTTISRSYNM